MENEKGGGEERRKNVDTVGKISLHPPPRVASSATREAGKEKKRREQQFPNPYGCEAVNASPGPSSDPM